MPHTCRLPYVQAPECVYAFTIDLMPVDCSRNEERLCAEAAKAQQALAPLVDADVRRAISDTSVWLWPNLLNHFRVDLPGLDVVTFECFRSNEDAVAAWERDDDAAGHHTEVQVRWIRDSMEGVAKPARIAGKL